MSDRGAQPGSPASSAAAALYRAAQAVCRPGGAELFGDLVGELADILGAAAAFIAVFTEDTRAELRMLAAVLDGKPLLDLQDSLEGSPWTEAVGRTYRHVASGAAAELPPGTIFATSGMDSYAALPFDDSAGIPLGLLVAMDRREMADATLVEGVLRIFAVRVAAEVERLRASDALERAAARHREAATAILASREEQYRAIFETSSDGFILWDEELTVVDANPAALRMYGYERERIVGRDLAKGLPPAYVREWLGLVRRAMAGETVQVETRGLRADGSGFDVDLRVMPFRHRGQPHVLAVARDITERHRADQTLRDSEAQYRGIFNASADALVLRDAAFRIVDVNATYETMSGYSRDEVIGVDRVLANPAHIREAIRELHERALTGEQVALQTELVRRDGTRYDLELRGVPVLHRGEPHVLYIGRDVTVAKRAEEALRSSEEQYRAIFNASTDALVLRDADYRAVDVNPAYLAMSGHSRDEVLESPWVLSRPEPQAHALHLERHARILAGERIRFEVTGKRKDGSRFDAEISGMPVRHRGELHVLYAARDITERREAEARRDELERQLRQAQKMEAIGQLTGGIAHDFNNILTSVIGYLVLGEERASRLDDAALQRQLGQAHLAAQRARDLIAQMLAFARRQRGEQRTLPAVPLVRQMLQLLRSTLPASVVVDFTVPGPARRDDEFAIVADAVQMEQVLFNLCINARDAIEGPGAIRVGVARATGGWHCASCRARVDGGSWVEISVADSGSGIAHGMLERMFEPFASSKEVGRGSGMGLAMVHGIVHDHRGHVVVETQLGKGSAFRVMLPAADAGAAPERREADSVATGRAMRDLLQGHVLVVEDEPMVGDFMVELLEGWGLDVSLQRDPMQALQWLEDTRSAVDLLLTDHTMPQMTGLELARRVRACRPGLPVVLYTGDTGSIDAADFARHGVRALLRKPIDAAALRELVRQCLQHPGADGAA